VASDGTTGDGPDKDIGGRASRITQNSAPPRAVRRGQLVFTNLVGVALLGFVVWNLVAGRYVPLIAMGSALAVTAGFLLIGYARSR
jgi:hypothetical protein